MLLPHVVPGDLYRICKKVVVSPHPGNLVKEDNSQCVVFYLVVKSLERGKPIVGERRLGVGLKSKLFGKASEFGLVRRSFRRTNAFYLDKPCIVVLGKLLNERRFADTATPSACH